MKKLTSGIAVMAIVIMAFLVVPATATADVHHIKKDDGCQQHFRVTQYRSVLRKAFAHDRWRDRTPLKKTDLAKLKEMRTCAFNPKVRKGMSKARSSYKQGFYQYRHYRRVLDHYTPYGKWAIPGYIVECESGGNWNAYNSSSGAFGPYQFLSSSYAAWCHECDRSHLDQHKAAYDYYRAAGASPWVCG